MLRLSCVINDTSPPLLLQPFLSESDLFRFLCIATNPHIRLLQEKSIVAGPASALVHAFEIFY